MHGQCAQVSLVFHDLSGFERLVRPGTAFQMQDHDGSVLAVTPNLLSQVSQRARRLTAADPELSERDTSSTAVLRMPCKHEAMYQTVSAPTLVGSRTTEHENTAPSQPEGHTDEGAVKPGRHAATPLQPPQHGFGSMQDLVHLSRSASVDSPACVAQPPATSLRSPLAPSPAPAADPTAAAPPQSAAVASDEPAATAALTCTSDGAAAAAHPAVDGPHAVSGATVPPLLPPERHEAAHSVDSAGDGDVTARPWSEPAEALREHSGVADAAAVPEDAPTWMTPSPPLKVRIPSASDILACAQPVATAALSFVLSVLGATCCDCAQGRPLALVLRAQCSACLCVLLRRTCSRGSSCNSYDLFAGRFGRCMAGFHAGTAGIAPWCDAGGIPAPPVPKHRFCRRHGLGNPCSHASSAAWRPI